MTNQPAIYLGKLFGKLKIVSKIPDDLKTRSPNLRKRWRVECQCESKTRLTIPEYYLIRKGNPKVDCGCSRKTIKTIYNEEYRIWNMMHVRCYDERHEAYKHYGGRGIGVCAEWHKDNPDGKGFERFLAYIGKRPSRAYSIDRVDNNLGYQPFQADGVTRQLRWATAEQQRANQRPPKS